MRPLLKIHTILCCIFHFGHGKKPSQLWCNHHIADKQTWWTCCPASRCHEYPMALQRFFRHHKWSRILLSSSVAIRNPQFPPKERHLELEKPGIAWATFTINSTALKKTKTWTCFSTHVLNSPEKRVATVGVLKIRSLANNRIFLG